MDYNSWPCSCGHSRGRHMGDFNGGRSFCNKTIENNVIVNDANKNDMFIICPCRRYVQDNLRYLEEQNEHK